MTLQSTTLRPGLLVSLKTSLTGSVDYYKRTIEQEHQTETGNLRARWETTKTISDPEEHERAEQARNKAGGLIRGVCARSAFGLLCPESDADQLDTAIKEARAIVTAFNQTSRQAHLDLYVICGRVAPDDVEAVRAINSEVRDLMSDMAEGIKNLDVKLVRDAASRAKSIGTMLPEETAKRIQAAVEVARSAARQIVKAGEQAAQEVDTRAIRQITDARMAFLDLDDAQEIAAPSESGRAIDLEPGGVEVAAAPVPQFAMEF